MLERLLDERLGDALAVTDEPRSEGRADLGSAGGLLDQARLGIGFERSDRLACQRGRGAMRLTLSRLWSIGSSFMRSGSTT